MSKHLIRQDPFDVFAPFLGLSRRWNEASRANGDEQGHMIVPALDLAETESEYAITAELPGLKKEDVKITIEKGVLTIAGEKKIEQESKKKDYHCVERRYGAFHRSVRMTNEVDVEKATASFEDGVLTVVVPKVEAAKPRELTIS